MMEHTMGYEMETLDIFEGTILFTPTQLKALKFGDRPKMCVPVNNLHMALQGNRSENWVLLRCSLVRCSFNCGSETICFRARSLYPNQICKGLKGLPYGRDRPGIIGLSLKTPGQDELSRVITRQKVFFAPCQHAALKTPDIQIHQLFPIDRTSTTCEPIEMRIILAFLPPSEAVHNFISLPYTGYPPTCRPTMVMDKLWHSRETSGDVTLKLFDPIEATTFVYEVKAHKLILSHSSPALAKMLEEGMYKESIDHQIYFPWNKETCQMFLQFCYFGNFPGNVLFELGIDGFPIAVELGLIASEYFMPCLLTASQQLCTYYLSMDQVNGHDIRTALFQCLNAIRNGSLKYSKAFYVNLVVYSRLRIPKSDFTAQYNLSNEVIDDFKLVDDRIGSICTKTSRDCETCAEIDNNLQRQSFSDLLM